MAPTSSNFVAYEPEDVPVAIKVPREPQERVPLEEAQADMPPMDPSGLGGSMGSSDDMTPDPVAESGMDCDVVQDERDLKHFLDVHGQRHAIRQAAKARYEDVISLVWSLGHDGGSYRREAARRFRAIVSEVYSARSSLWRPSCIRDSDAYLGLRSICRSTVIMAKPGTSASQR